VPALVERLWAEDGGCQPRYIQFALIYVYVEGLAVLAVLAACGVLADGNRVLVHLAPQTKEDSARLPEVLPGPAPARLACDRLASRGSKGPEGGPLAGYFTP
jgi:hypothetical protein